MKTILAALSALTLVGGASVAFAQDTTTVIHHDDGADRSKTVVEHENGAKTVIKRNGNHMKKVHTSPNSDKTVVKTTTTPD